MTIYGIIPCGGFATRLGLPFAKELLPQKDYGHYRPIIDFTVQNMINAKCEQIIFVHGAEYKKEIKKYYPKHKHVRQLATSFSQTLITPLVNTEIKEGDIILFGLPDSIYKTNHFCEMIKTPGIVCGIYTTKDNVKVDRLIHNTSNKFSVKSTLEICKTTNLFWGVLKFDCAGYKRYIELSDNQEEIGEILNLSGFVITKSGGEYLDIGTWENLNYYWNEW